MSSLDKSAVPAFPVPGVAYDRDQQAAFQNALRLYLNGQNNSMNALVGVNGGRYLGCPNAVFFDITAQTVALPNVGYPVQFGQVYLDNAVRITDGTKICTDIAGIYNFQFSGQIESTSSSAKTVWLWLRRSNDDIGFSTHVYTISGSGTHLDCNWNFNIDMQVGQCMELIWAVSDVNTRLVSTPATAPHPGVPSAVMAVNFVSPLPDELPTPP